MFALSAQAPTLIIDIRPRSVQAVAGVSPWMVGAGNEGRIARTAGTADGRLGNGERGCVAGRGRSILPPQRVVAATWPTGRSPGMARPTPPVLGSLPLQQAQTGRMPATGSPRLSVVV